LVTCADAYVANDWVSIGVIERYRGLPKPARPEARTSRSFGIFVTVPKHKRKPGTKVSLKRVLMAS
jgi:hypothetical protein